MYCDFYELRERPFNVTSDPKFLYLNARYREALASLHYGISQRKGFITLIGEAGTGKTTLLKKLLDDLDENTRTVFVFNTNVTFDEILEYIFGEFDLPVHNGKRLYMLQRLNGFLLEELRQGRNVALLIDEAQDLEYSVLEDLRLLSNLETAKEKILQIVLSGQPELGQKLDNPNLRQLRQRVAVGAKLLPLTREELTEYIQARLIAAGAADPRIFTRDAEDRIFEISTGIPRIVNVVCDNALVIGYALGKRRVSADVVNEAAADLITEERPASPGESAAVPFGVPEPARRGRNVSQLGVVAVVVIAILIGLLSVGRSLLLRDDTEESDRVASRRSLQVIQPGTDDGAPAPRLAPPAPLRDGRASDGEEPPQRNAALDDPGSAEWTEQFDRGSRLDDAERDSYGGRYDEDADIRVLDRGRDGEALANAGPEASINTRRRELSELQHAIESALEALGDGKTQDGEKVKERRDDSSRRSREDPEGMVAAAAPRELPPAQPPVFVSFDGLANAPGADIEGQTAAERNDAPRTSSSSGGLSLALPREQTVVVHDGDSISKIASRTYGQASHTILDLMLLANPNVTNVDMISTGQQLHLPKLDEGFVVLRQDDGNYALLLLSTPARSQAERVRAALRGNGFQVRIAPGSLGPGRSVNRVLVGDLPSREEALITGRKLQQLFRDNVQIATMAR